MSDKVALITGIEEEVGSQLAEFLLNKGYEVHGIISPIFVKSRKFAFCTDKGFILHAGVPDDYGFLKRIISEIKPTEIYKLTSLTKVRNDAFDMALHVSNTEITTSLNILEAVKDSGLINHTRIFQASRPDALTCKTGKMTIDESSRHHPLTPDGVSKLYSYGLVGAYRYHYQMFACNGMYLSEGSSTPGISFLATEIVSVIKSIAEGHLEYIVLGNLDLRKEWGLTKDYIEAMWLILQHDKPEDFLISTGKKHTVKEFVRTAFKYFGISICWEGYGAQKVGRDRHTGVLRVKVDPGNYQPDVENWTADCTKINTTLKWKPKCNLMAVVEEIVKRINCEGQARNT